MVKLEENPLQTATQSEVKPLQTATIMPHNHTQVRRCLLELWDMVIDLQDHIATTLALYEHPDPGIQNGTAWVYRPGMEPEKVDLTAYAKEVLGIE